MSWFDTLLWPIKIVVAWILVGFHNLFTALGMSAAGGWSWALSIVGLVLVIRTLLIPLFVRQIRAARGLQLLSPELQAIQKKYKGKTDPASREAMSRETMELYRKHGTNPFSSCLPILAQSPIFFALFRVLANLELVAEGKYAKPSIGPITQSVAEQASSATIFGAPISSAFLNPTATTATRVVSMVLIVAMSITTFTTQRQLTQKNMPASALQGPMAQQQKMLLYAMPLLFAFSGVNFQIGVLIYWTTTNLWSMGQQFYVIRRNPTPGSEAERLLRERRARKAAAKGIVLEDEAPAIEEKPRGQREQPKRKDRARPTGAGGATGGAGTAAAGDGVQDSPARPAQRPAGSTGGQRAQGAKGAAGGKGAGAKAAGGAASGSTGAKAAGGAKAGGTGAGTGGAKPAAGGSGARPARPARPTIPEEGTSKGGSSAADGDTPARPRRPKRPTTPPPADSDE